MSLVLIGGWLSACSSANLVQQDTRSPEEKINETNSTIRDAGSGGIKPPVDGAKPGFLISGPASGEVANDFSFSVTPPELFSGAVKIMAEPVGISASASELATIEWGNSKVAKMFSFRPVVYGAYKLSLKSEAVLAKNTVPFAFFAKVQLGATGPMDPANSSFKPADYISPDLGKYKFFRDGGPLAVYGQKIDQAKKSIYSDEMMRVFQDQNTVNAGVGLNAKLYPGGFDMNEIVGMPLVVVDGKQKKVPIRFLTRDDDDDALPLQSTPGPYPIPPNARIQGIPGVLPPQEPEPIGHRSDTHMIVFDRDNDLLYETYHTFKDPINGWTAANGWVVDLKNSSYPNSGPADVKSSYRFPGAIVTAAGLPILPLSIRYDEVFIHQEINHAIGMTLPNVKLAGTWVWPARGIAYSNRMRGKSSRETGDNDWGMTIPYGARLRLKKDWYDAKVTAKPQDWGPGSLVVLKALREYGSVIVDGGITFDLWQIADSRWSTGDFRVKNYEQDLFNLFNVPSAAFEVIEFEDDLLEIKVVPEVAAVGAERTITITYHGWSRHPDEYPGSSTDREFQYIISPRDIVTDLKRFTPYEVVITPQSPTAVFKYTPTTANQEWYPLSEPVGLPWPYANGPWILRTN